MSGKAGCGVLQDLGAGNGKGVDREGLGVVTEIATSVLTARSSDPLGGVTTYGSTTRRGGVCGIAGQDVAMEMEEVG